MTSVPPGAAGTLLTSPGPTSDPIFETPAALGLLTAGSGVVTVSSISALRGLTFSTYAFAQVSGYYSAADGGGSFFVYNPADTATGAYGTGSITGTVFTCTALTNGTYVVGQALGGVGVTPGTRIVSLGTGVGGLGTYNVSLAQTVGSTAIVADDGGSVIVALDGGRWDNIQKVNLNVLQFGAKGDGVTDDTWAIQSCYNAITLGGTLRIPAAPGGSYACSPQNGNAYVFNFSRFINIQADGFNSILAPTASTTTDTILCQPVATVAYFGMFWDGLCLGTPSTGKRNGIHGIHIDTTQAISIGVEFSGFKCTRTYIGQSNSNGNAFIHSNSAGNNPNGGMFSAMICDCPGLNGGIVLNQSGDSNHIERNVITGNGIGVTATLVSGASELTIIGNNITTNGGQIVVNSGSRTRIENNNIEQQVATTGSTVMINLTGSLGLWSTAHSLVIIWELLLGPA